MKKVLAVAAFAAFGLMSCKKDYTCECTTTSAGVSSGTTSITINDTKKKATEACEGSSSSSTVFGVVIESSCAIK